MTEREAAFVHQQNILGNEQFELLEQWINKYYRDKLHVDDLADFKLLQESRTTLDELTKIFKLGPIYSFQK